MTTATAAVAAFATSPAVPAPPARRAARLIAAVTARAAAGRNDEAVRLLTDPALAMAAEPGAASSGGGPGDGVPHGGEGRLPPEWAALVTAVAATPDTPGTDPWSLAPAVVAAAFAVARTGAGTAAGSRPAAAGTAGDAGSVGGAGSAAERPRAAGDSGAPGETGADDDVRTAVAAGMEVGARLLTALGPALTARGLDGTGVCGHVAAVVAAGHLLRLDQAAMTSALGLAATQAAGLAIAAGTMAARLNAGKAAGDAVQAAMLARDGYTASPAGLDGRRGLAALLAPGADLDPAFADLGRRWRFAEAPDPAPGDPDHAEPASPGDARTAGPPVAGAVPRQPQERP